jgi:O-antigen/teichoic acid export membrane protein
MSSAPSVPVEKPHPPKVSRFTFFRQSGWMIIAAVAGGVFMWAVHPVLVKPVGQVNLGAVTDFLNRFIQEPISKSSYGLFNTLLSILGIMSIPATGLQTIFTQQAAAAVDEAHRRQLRGTVRTVLAATTLIWVACVVVVFVVRQKVLAHLNIPDPSALWVTILIGLPILWMPVLGGLLLGRQNFLWFGWAAICGGFGRFLAIVLIVRMLGGGVTGAMLAVLAGAGGALVIYLWQSYSDWHGTRDPVEWRAWMRRVVPLTLGFGATTFMLSADMIVVRSVFPEEQTGFYSAAGIIGRALVFFTIPLASVMFPKIVQSAARAERTDVMAQALGATALLGAGAALFCTFFPGLPLQLVYEKSYLVIKPLVPWFAWCMLPLTLSNVLISNLLAREKFAVVPLLVAVAVAYGLVLLAVSPLLGLTHHLSQAEQLAAFKTVVQILGGFSLLLLSVSAYFTWRKT